MSDYILHLGDCLEKMDEIEDGSIDLILADLPYGMTACKWDAVIPFEPLWDQYKRIIKRNGAIVLTASQPFTSALVMSNLKWFRYEWIWEKQRGTNFLWANKMPLKNHESVLVFGSKLPNYFPQKTDLHLRSTRLLTQRKTNLRDGKTSPNLREGCKAAHSTYGGEYIGRFPKTVQRFSNESMNSNNYHPSQKPVALMEYLIRTYTEEGEIVLDNTMGSGTAGVACMNTGRKFIGIERDPGYFNIASERIEAAVRSSDENSLLFATS